jgi:hypothetical protein
MFKQTAQKKWVQNLMAQWWDTVSFNDTVKVFLVQNVGTKPLSQILGKDEKVWESKTI